jgi:NTE family protein
MTERTALVLGAGGAYGWVFHAGVLSGIERALGMSADDIDLIIGTSAGAAVGAAARAGVDPQRLADVVSRPPSEEDRKKMVAELRGARKSLMPFAPHLAQHVGSTSRRGMVGVAGLLPPGIFPTSWIAAFPGMDHHATWPAGLWIPAVAATTGETVVFGRDRDDVDVHRAAQASSAVPGMFQPHVIDGIPYFDGGVASPTHADLAVDIHPGLVIISTPMTRPGRRFTAGHARRRLAEEVAVLERAGVRVVIIQPDIATGALADGFPRRTGSNAPRIAEAAADAAERSIADVGLSNLIRS